MDIHEQVNKLISELENQEMVSGKTREVRLMEEAVILDELNKRYMKSLDDGKWDLAEKFLSQISELVIIMRCE
jgi:hypothetical protein